MGSANERRCYIVTTSPIGWAYTLTDPWADIILSKKLDYVVCTVVHASWSNIPGHLSRLIILIFNDSILPFLPISIILDLSLTFYKFKTSVSIPYADINSIPLKLLNSLQTHHPVENLTEGGRWEGHHRIWDKYGNGFRSVTLQWRHNGRDGVSNHQPHDCLHIFRRRSKKTSKLRVTGLCAGNSPLTGEISAQMASNAENVSIWWRHHGIGAIRGPRASGQFG